MPPYSHQDWPSLGSVRTLVQSPRPKGNGASMDTAVPSRNQLGLLVKHVHYDDSHSVTHCVVFHCSLDILSLVGVARALIPGEETTLGLTQVTCHCCQVFSDRPAGLGPCTYFELSLATWANPHAYPEHMVLCTLRTCSWVVWMEVLFLRAAQCLLRADVAVVCVCLHCLRHWKS